MAANIIIIVIIAIIAVIAIRSTRKHMRGEGSCCGGGGGTLRPEKKVLAKEAIGTATLKISGMTCENCENRVWRALDRMDDVAVTDISHRKGTAVIAYSADIPRENLEDVISQAGYTLTEVE